MAMRQAAIGQEVFSNDGQKIGSVNQLVLNTDNNHVENLVVSHGLLSGDKLIDIDLIDQSTSDRIVVGMSAAEAEDLPDFVEDQFVAAPADTVVEQPFVVPATGSGRFLYGATTMGRGYQGGGSFFEPAPIGAPVVENRSNLPAQDIMIGKGTDVVGSDGSKVGTVDEVLFAQNGDLEGFIVKAGFLFKHDVQVPMEWVADTGHEQIRLSVSADDAERRQGR